LVGIFLDDCPKLLLEIRRAVEREDSEALERAGHTMKGVLGYFSSDGAVSTALRLQQMGANRDLRGAARALVELEQLVAHLNQSLKELGSVYAK